MSVISYDNVTFPYTHIISMRQDGVYDDVSHTDWCGTAIDLQCQSIVDYNYLAALYPTLIGKTTNPAEIKKAIRTRLMQPRRALSVKCGGIELIPGATGGLGTVDTANGPIPQSCVLTDLTNESFLMTYHIKGVYWENNITNPNGNPITENIPGNPILFNRWTEIQTIDQNQFSTVVREGKYKIRADNVEGYLVDDGRGKLRERMCQLGLRDGFIRTSSQYTVTPDGLAMQYRIEDKQAFKLPPDPAFKASGEYFEETTRMGARRYGGVRLRLEGGPTTPQQDLVKKAVAIAAARMALRGQQAGGNGFTILEHASVRVDMYENIVDLSMRAFMAPNLKSVAFANMTTLTPGSDDVAAADVPNLSVRKPYIYGQMGAAKAGVLLRAASYWDPSLLQALDSQGINDDVKVDPATGQSTAGLEIGTAGKNKEQNAQGF